jgi:hypothetical protein
MRDSCGLRRLLQQLLMSVTVNQLAGYFFGMVSIGKGLE